MATTARKKRRPHLLSSTRPGNLKPQPTASSRAARATIRAHHTLRKQLSSALVKEDKSEVKRIENQIEDLGGIHKYQQASIQGQSVQRGGDTSKVLVEWLRELSSVHTMEEGRPRRLRLLEVGALRADNACARSEMFDLERIDLHSQHPDIKEQDLMARPVPSTMDVEQAGFDVVSLSLVINFVGDAIQRGEMLKRVESFLRPSAQPDRNPCPSLFLVLPAPCVNNSRYLDENKLERIMNNLGYTKLKSKTSSKLVYYLWKYGIVTPTQPEAFMKKELRAGKSRNNFAIVLT